MWMNVRWELMTAILMLIVQIPSVDGLVNATVFTVMLAMEWVRNVTVHFALLTMLKKIG